MLLEVSNAIWGSPLFLPTPFDAERPRSATGGGIRGQCSPIFGFPLFIFTHFGIKRQNSRGNTYGEGCVLGGKPCHYILHKCVARFVSELSFLLHSVVQSSTITYSNAVVQRSLHSALLFLYLVSFHIRQILCFLIEAMNPACKNISDNPTGFPVTFCAFWYSFRWDTFASI